MVEIRKMYDMPIGCYCGVFLSDKAMKKVAKLLYKQSAELKALLLTLEDEIIQSHWTLAYPNGKQEGIYYTKEEYGDSLKKRINLLDKSIHIKPVNVYITSEEEAINEHMKLHDDSTEI